MDLRFLAKDSNWVAELDRLYGALGAPSNALLLPRHFIEVVLPKLGGKIALFVEGGREIGVGFLFPRAPENSASVDPVLKPAFTLRFHALAPETSYFPGATSAPLHELLPDWITRRMREGLRLFDRRIRGYASRDALLLGFETRTSSPVRIPRRDDTLEHPEVGGLFPCGEGAGYAGGIVSAALDGMRVAEAACAAARS